MATPTYDQNGVIFQRRFSRAYEQPIVQSTSKGIVVRPSSQDGRDSSLSHTSSVENPKMEALGSMVAKGTLGLIAAVGILAGILDKASLQVISQLFGFMLMYVATFMACTGSFYWWGGISMNKVKLTIKKIIIIYFICVSSDVVARMISAFTDIPPTSPVPADTSYFISFATLLLFIFSLLVHSEGVNAMFSQESVIFVTCTVVLNFTSICLFREVLPHLLLPQMVYVGVLLGLSLSLAGYTFPSMSLSGIYWMFHQSGRARAPVVVDNVSPSLPRISVDLHSHEQSRRSSASSSMRQRASFSSISSITSAYPQSVDNEVVNEAHGLLSELLSSKDSITGDTHQKLRRIKDLLAPRFDRTLGIPKVHIGNQIENEDHDYESDVGSESSPSKQSSLQPSRANKSRSQSVVQLRRSTTGFATTTTATGLPVLENEPVDRQRSLALRDVKARISGKEKRYSVHKMGTGRERFSPGRERLGSDGQISRLRSPSTLSHSSSLSVSRTSSETELSELEASGSSTTVLPQITENVTEGANRQPVALSPLHRMGESQDENLESISEGVELELSGTRPRSATMPKDLKTNPFSGEIETKKEEEEDKNKTDTEEGVFGTGQIAQHKFYSFTRYKRPSEVCDLVEYSSSDHFDMMENVAVWDYPIFELEEKAGNHILSHMAHRLFHEAGLMETFQIPQREFINYFRALEANYGSNVYHNKTHASDVLHAVSYLLFEMIPEFSHEFSGNEGTDREWKGHSRSKESGGNIASAFNSLEVLAIYMASAMHDFDHPGRTNAFLVSTKSTLAQLYNDRSVLENHHAAASLHLLTNFEENNFLTSLDQAEMKRLRFLIIEAILATDLKMHFDILSDFRAKVNPEDGGGIDWNSEMDRMLVIKMIIKMADISTPAKNFELHRRWTERITEEFYQQSEEEVELGLQPTIFMDRKHPEKLPAIQLSFIQHLVSPLFQACAEAGIIPGILEPVEPQTSPSPERTVNDKSLEFSSSLDGDAESPFPSLGDGEEEATQKFMSIILTNLHVNYEGWKAELPKEEGEEEEVKKEEEEGNKEENGENSKVDVGAATNDLENKSSPPSSSSPNELSTVVSSEPPVPVAVQQQ